ncbi:MAG: AAA family ATPase, partial [Nitrospiraceae bacterium]
MTLANEHLDDLHRSGLSDDVILAMQCEAIRPSEITVSGAKSAYRIPYFTIDGTRNCFERWKLFPTVIRLDGRKQKYHQPAGTDPELYLSPLLSWRRIAGETSLQVLIVEGEKKAAAGSAKGLFAIGVGGLWNWRQKMETGERLVIPTVDLFQWTNREVLLVPDSDAWRRGREEDLLGGFYAFGQELVSRGALVRFSRLPESGGSKVGLDDWLVRLGDDWKHCWPKLERIGLDDTCLKAVSAWWQQWREKQALEDQFRSTHAEEMEVSVIAGESRVRFPEHRVTFRFNRLTDIRGGVSAELTVHIGTVELLGETDIGLKSDSAREKISKTLKGFAVQIPWKRLLERACTAVLKAHREGSPIVILNPTEQTSSHVPFLLNPLVYRGHQTLAFAPGGSCKSYLALYFALLACHGLRQSGIAPVKASVLYLDWELDRLTVESRLKAIQAGHPELGKIRPHYRRCEYPLHQEVHQIAIQVASLGIQLLIIDSAALACGGDLASPDSAIRLQRALRTIGCASLVLAHVPKAVQEGQEVSAYGTVFFRELARNVWEFQKANGGNPVRVSLHQKKNNFGPPLPPLGFEITFQETSVQITSFNAEEEPECEARLPMASRIRNLLEDGNL